MQGQQEVGVGGDSCVALALGVGSKVKVTFSGVAAAATGRKEEKNR